MLFQCLVVYKNINLKNHCLLSKSLSDLRTLGSHVFPKVTGADNYWSLFRWHCHRDTPRSHRTCSSYGNVPAEVRTPQLVPWKRSRWPIQCTVVSSRSQHRSSKHLNWATVGLDHRRPHKWLDHLYAGRREGDGKLFPIHHDVHQPVTIIIIDVENLI